MLLLSSFSTEESLDALENQIFEKIINNGTFAPQEQMFHYL